ncbi:MAG: hypothetical protein LM580_11795 [Thermofilum sp.]|nr:hypothetical protein [Thermofilum sp.]
MGVGEAKRLRAWRIARLLFKEMERFDRLALVLDDLDSLLALVDADNVQDVMQFYDLDELGAKLRAYARKCSELADAVEELLREAGRE